MRPLTAKSLVAFAVLASATLASAQSLGDVARQERARRAAAPPSSKRVITNEDLQRERILEPRVAAAQAEEASAQSVSPVPALPSADTVVPLWSSAPDRDTSPSAQPSQITLADFARKVREERAARRRAREILARQEEQQRPVTASAPSAPVPVPAPQREPVVAAVPPRAVARPVARKARSRRSAARVVFASANTSSDVLVVQRGDSLWKIAQREFGDGRMWTVLWQANPEIADPNLIYKGQALRRPAAEQIAQLKAPRSPQTLRASRKPQSSTPSSFAAQVLTRDTRKASIRNSESLPLLAPPAPSNGTSRSGPHRSPR